MDAVNGSFDGLRAELPQGYPFVLLDRIVDLVPSERIVAVKNVSGTEWVFAGHFPEHAAYPSVLLIESMAQASIILFKASAGGVGGTFLIVGVRSQFFRTVVPGDQVLFKCTAKTLGTNGSIVDGEATVGGACVARATLTFVVRPAFPDLRTTKSAE